MARRKIPIDEAELEKIKTMAGMGLKHEQMAAILGMSIATFNRRLKDTKGAFDSIEKGRSAAAFNVTQTAYNLAISGKVPAMTMFWLKCRERWRETQVLEHTGKDGGPIESKDVDSLSDEQLEAKIESMLPKPHKEIGH